MYTSKKPPESFIGGPASKLPTPALLLSRHILESNTSRLLDDVQAAGIDFRPHVKTLKSTEVTRLMLGDLHSKVAVSTIEEIRGLLPLIREGTVKEVLYGLPCYPGALAELASLAQEIKIILMIDNEAHVKILEDFSATLEHPLKWQAFIKVDMGSRRAGLQLDSPRLQSLIKTVEASSTVSIYGFYCHAGHSYGSRTPEAAAEILHDEISAASQAAALMSTTDAVVISIGATPTAHVISSFKEKLPSRLRLELHAGNYPANDLQQVATGSVKLEDQAIRVLAEVCSVYPERNEAIVNAGCIALARESGAIPGFAQVTDADNWNVGRLSQEHGILVALPESGEKVEDRFHIGDKVLLYIQHACITAAAYAHYFIVDADDIVQEVWHPWKGW